MPQTVGPNAQQQTPSGAGGYFAYTSATTVTLTISGFDGHCHVEVGNATSKRVVSFNANKTMDLTVAGPGGLHPGHAEQVSTVYTVYLAWKSATAARNGTISLFAVPSGTTIDAAKLTALEAGYDYVSRPIGFVANNAAGNIEPFKQRGSWWTYNTTMAALSGGKATVATTVPLAPFVPAEASTVNLTAFAYHNAASYRGLSFTTNTDGTLFTPTGLLNGSNGIHLIPFNVPIRSTLALLIAYQWDNAPTNGLDIGIKSIQLVSSLSDREGP